MIPEFDSQNPVKNAMYWTDKVVYIYNPTTQEAEVGESLWVQSQPYLHTKIQDSQGYIVRQYLLKRNIFMPDE